MKLKEIQQKTDTDLLKQLADLREETRDLRFRIVSKEIKNNQILKQKKKDIARILTVLKERSHGA